MNKTELRRALQIAESNVDLGDSLLDPFDGFGLPDFRQVNVTLRAVAKLIRWQCGTFSGEWDQEKLNEIAYHGRHRFQIIDESEVSKKMTEVTITWRVQDIHDARESNEMQPWTDDKCEKFLYRIKQGLIDASIPAGWEEIYMCLENESEVSK